MERRIPTLSATDRIADGLRRRSGGPAAHHASLPHDNNPVIPSEDDALSRKPTILLVQHSQSSSTPQPFVPYVEDRPIQQQGQFDVSFTPIPLTPRPDLPSRAPTEASMQSAYTRASQIPRLPTPDFGNSSETRTTANSGTGRVANSFRSFFPRGLSFVSLPVPSSSFLSHSPTPVASRPQSLRSDSDESSRSAWSSCTAASVDSGHSTLIPSVGTTDKFTHKWPKMRGLDVHDGDEGRGSRLRGIAAAAAVLEEGRGLGTSSVQRWTTFKWCLLFSVCTVFIYGIAGLACGILTWFRSRLIFFDDSKMPAELLWKSLGTSRYYVRGRQRCPHPYYFGCVYHGFHRVGWDLWSHPQFTPYLGDVYAPSMACLHVATCRRLR